MRYLWNCYRTNEIAIESLNDYKSKAPYLPDLITEYPIIYGIKQLLLFDE